MEYGSIVDAALIGISSAYAAWLRREKRHEPDWTWVSVAAGAALCLAAAGGQSRLGGGDWRAHEQRVWRAFVLGGAPIIVGEVAQWLERRAERRRYIGLRQ